MRQNYTSMQIKDELSSNYLNKVSLSASIA